MAKIKGWYVRLITGRSHAVYPDHVIHIQANPHTFKLVCSLTSMHMHFKVMLF